MSKVFILYKIKDAAVTGGIGLGGTMCKALYYTP